MGNMRKLVVFLVLFSTAFAVCTDYTDVVCNSYVVSAANLGPTCAYPECFGAAGEYKKAAECYSCANDLSSANIYFQKAADYYLEMAAYMDASGDHPLRAPSYEYAGDMVAQLGNRYLADTYYDSAISEYLKTDNYAKANLVNQKKEALHEVPEPEAPTGWVLSGESLAVGALVVLIAIVAFVYFRTPQRPEMPVLQEKPTFKMDAPKKFEAPEDQAKVSAKEKMRDKIRKKYGLE